MLPVQAPQVSVSEDGRVTRRESIDKGSRARLLHSRARFLHTSCFLLCGGMGQEAAVVVKKLVDALATEHDESYSQVVSWI